MDASSTVARWERCVVGGGIVGLAVARELALGGARVVVLERESELASHQSSHNSGVVHSGIYYAPGSLKARLCVEGARELRVYCERHGLPLRRCGKLIVAREEHELERLGELERRARANGVPAVTRLDADGLRALEPGARGVAALHLPETAITDFAAVARSFAQDVRAAGGAVVTDAEVVGFAEHRGLVTVEHRRGRLEAGRVVVCAGLWSDRLAVAAGAPSDPRIVPFRGTYLRAAGIGPPPVSRLVYPVPDPALPFLGVHLTPTLGGDLLIGPTALPALSHGLRSTLAWPGTWRMARRWWRTGLSELRLARTPAAAVAEASRLVDGLGEAEPAFAGVRAQALGRDGTLVDDFVFSRTGRILHVRNAPSPGATASLAIAAEIAERLSADESST